jgi:hypothetical protein
MLALPANVCGKNLEPIIGAIKIKSPKSNHSMALPRLEMSTSFFIN